MQHNFLLLKNIPHFRSSDPECVIMCLSVEMLHMGLHACLSLTRFVATATTCSLSFPIAMCYKNRKVESGNVGNSAYFSPTEFICGGL